MTENSTTTIRDLAEHLAELHAADCESMGASWGPRDAHEAFEAGDLAGWLRGRGLPAGEEGVEALRKALELALNEALELALNEALDVAVEYLDAEYVDGDDDAPTYSDAPGYLYTDATDRGRYRASAQALEALGRALRRARTPADRASAYSDWCADPTHGVTRID